MVLLCVLYAGRVWPEEGWEEGAEEAWEEQEHPAESDQED